MTKLARFFSFKKLKILYPSSCRYFFFSMLKKGKHCYIIRARWSRLSTTFYKFSWFSSSKRRVYQFIQFLVKLLSINWETQRFDKCDKELYVRTQTSRPPEHILIWWRQIFLKYNLAPPAVSSNIWNIYFLSLEIWILGTGIYLEIEVAKFDSLLLWHKG